MNRNIRGEIHLLGVGHNTPVFIDLVEACGLRVAGIYHYNASKVGEVCGNKLVTGTHEQFFQADPTGKVCVLTMGDNEIRCALADRLKDSGAIVPTLVHPLAVVSSSAHLEEGVVVHALAVVQAGAKIGRDSVISAQSLVVHSSKIGRGCYISSQAMVGAYAEVGELVLVGMGSCLVSGKAKSVGDKATIGAGAVVLSDVEAATVVVGNPARVVRKI